MPSQFWASTLFTGRNLGTLECHTPRTDKAHWCHLVWCVPMAHVPHVTQKSTDQGLKFVESGWYVSPHNPLPCGTSHVINQIRDSGTSGFSSFSIPTHVTSQIDEHQTEIDGSHSSHSQWLWLTLGFGFWGFSLQTTPTLLNYRTLKSRGSEAPNFFYPSTLTRFEGLHMSEVLPFI